MKSLLTAFLLLLWVTGMKAQTFNGTGGTIPDDGSFTRYTIPVGGLQSSIDSTFGLTEVCFNIIHPYTGDLNIWLICPDSTYIELSTGNGGSGNNYWQTCLEDNALNFISSSNAPFSGSFRPESPLYVANNGQNPNQTWQLMIQDAYSGDAGILLNWTITFSANPPQGFQFSSSNLPIIKINTMGQAILDDPKIMATMGIIDNGPGQRNYVSDPANHYNGFIGIETRGSSSQTFPKKSFGLETWDSTGNEIDTALLGMPSESDWILNANYTDKTLMRNVLMYDIGQSLGYYASRTRYCEVILNGQYMGVYIFMEKIKRDNERVDIAKMTPADTSGDDLTGGYILKVDKTTGSGGAGWVSSFNPPSGGQPHTIQVEYPDPADLLPVQEQYIEAYCDSFETATAGPGFTNPVSGYRKYIDLQSWVDYFLLSELSKNVDGYRISTYFYKQKDSDGGKLYMGPLWDYDIAWGNADYYGGDVSSGYSYQFNNTGDAFQVPFWWNKFMQDPFWRNTARCRWEELRDSVISTQRLHDWIDSVGVLLDESQTRNFTLWPILGVYVWPNPSPLPPDYTGVKQELKNWITNRGNWLDANLPGVCSLTGYQDVHQPSGDNATAYPNPAMNDTWILLPDNMQGVIRVTLFNELGQTVQMTDMYIQDEKAHLDLSGIAKGLYIAEIKSPQKTYRSKFIKSN